jgi:hypothetical protein
MGSVAHYFIKSGYCVYENIPGFVLELREYEPTTPLPLSSSKSNRGVRQMFEDMEISVK